MMDLLKNKNLGQDFPKTRDKMRDVNFGKTAEEVKTEPVRKGVDIGKFADPEGLSVKKMDIGLWILENRGHFLFLLTLLFASISIITWSIFVYSFGSYVIVGMKQDKALSENLLSSMVVGHDYYMLHAPKRLEYEPVQILNNLEGVYDFVTRVNNPNPNYWVEIDYSFTVDGKKFGESTGFVLPGESKNLISLGHNFKENPLGVKMNIDKERWHRIDKHIYPDWQQFYSSHLKVPVKEVSFVPAETTILTEKVDLNTLRFTVVNDSAYNYQNMGFVIVLYNNNKILGVDRYALNRFMSDQTRTVDITWPGKFGKVTDVSITPELNITKNDIYIDFGADSDNVIMQGDQDVQ